MNSQITSFDEKLRPISRRLYGYARALTRDNDRADDLYQDTIVKAVSAGRAAPAAERLFRAWMFSIMRNHWIDRLRTERRQPEIDSLSDEAVVESFMPGSLESVLVNQLAVRLAFERLSFQHRDILSLVDIGGFSYEEAAEMLKIPKGTVMSRVSRARQALCHLLADDTVIVHPASFEGRKS